MTTAPCSTRHALPADLDVLASFAATLWPDGTTESHAEHFALILRGEPPSTLPLVLFVAEVEGDLAGFLEVGLRSHADGCDPSHPVAFVEGWFVAETHRARGVGPRARERRRGMGPRTRLSRDRVGHVAR
jgi:aminoglycoside 6'-N-acetyltransferase I